MFTATADSRRTERPPRADEIDVLARIDRKVAKHGARPALSVWRHGAWRSWSYADVHGAARRLAGWMLECGVRGDRVAILSESKPEWGIAFFATVRAGGTVVPLDVQLTCTELSVILCDAEPRVLLVSPRFLAVARALRDEVRSIREVVILADDDQEVDLGRRYQELEAARPCPLPPRRSAETAVLTYTSGTTGAPKGVRTTFANLMHQVTAISAVFGCPPEDRVLSVLPMHHLFTLTAGFLSPLWSGSEICYSESLLPDDVAQRMREKAITRMVVVPLFLKLLRSGIEQKIAARPRWQRAAFRAAYCVMRICPSRWLRRLLFRRVLAPFGGRLQYFVSGGASLDADTAGFFLRLGIPAYQGYGLTEASPIVSTNTPRHDRPGSVGRPLPAVQVCIRRNRPEDREGEILTRGPHVMAGYCGGAVSTSAVVDAEGWLHTGDVGCIDEAGYLYLTGRLTDVIILGSGKNVQPEEVEGPLGASVAFREICVVGVARRGEATGDYEDVAVVVVPRDRAATECRVRAEVDRLTRGLANYKRPTVVLLCREALPRTSTAKVKRARVRAWANREISQPEDKS